MTAEQLRSPSLATKPMKPEVWLLRTMILQPERICDPKDLERWKRERETPVIDPKQGKRK